MKLAELRDRFRSIQQKPPARRCTKCGDPALYVATDASGLQWYECEGHDPTDNVAQTTRVSLTPIAEMWKAVETGEPMKVTPAAVVLPAGTDLVMGIDHGSHPDRTAVALLKRDHSSGVTTVMDVETGAKALEKVSKAMRGVSLAAPPLIDEMRKFKGAAERASDAVDATAAALGASIPTRARRPIVPTGMAAAIGAAAAVGGLPPAMTAMARRAHEEEVRKAHLKQKARALGVPKGMRICEECEGEGDMDIGGLPCPACQGDGQVADPGTSVCYMCARWETTGEHAGLAKVLQGRCGVDKSNAPATRGNCEQFLFRGKAEGLRYYKDEGDDG